MTSGDRELRLSAFRKVMDLASEFGAVDPSGGNRRPQSRREAMSICIAVNSLEDDLARGVVQWPDYRSRREAEVDNALELIERVCDEWLLLKRLFS